ncbi:MAG: hypothetical protein HFE84_03830 [Lachnospiraceae bacterium]|nr:hypothetical protein [Lachnospiraceae bacterium]
MNEQESKELREDVGEKEKQQAERFEVGYGSDGAPSAEALKRWLFRAALAVLVCLLSAGILAFLFLKQDKKEASVLEVEAAGRVEFLLNRKGEILGVSGRFGYRSFKEIKGLPFSEGLAALFQELSGQECLKEGNAVLITVRTLEGGVRVSSEELAEEIEVCARNLLKAKQSKSVVYVGTVTENTEILRVASANGSSLGKMTFVQDLIKNNAKLRASDESRLSGYSVDQIAEEISKKAYRTSFAAVAVKPVYEKKPDETSGETEPSEPTTEESSESETEKAPEEIAQPESSQRRAPETRGTRAAERAESSQTASREEAPGETSAASAPEEITMPSAEEPKTEAPTDRTEPKPLPEETPETAETAPPETVPAETVPHETEAAPVETEVQETVPKYMVGPGFV